MGRPVGWYMPAKPRTDSPYTTLLDRIIRGQIPPGSRLTENEIAGFLGISRTPAREALKRLHADGFLVPRKQQPRTELVVAPLGRDDLEEVYAVMASLEAAAVRQLFRSTPAERSRIAAAMARANSKLERIGRKDPYAYEHLFAAHNEVHRIFVEAGAGPRLAGLIAAMRPHAERYEWMYAPYVGPGYDDTYAEHAAIIAALKKTSATQAAAAVAANWENSAQRLLAAIERAGSRGGWGRLDITAAAPQRNSRSRA
jgi:DNA-binding GntR family transcriptional regulator